MLELAWEAAALCDSARLGVPRLAMKCAILGVICESRNDPESLHIGVLIHRRFNPQMLNPAEG
jgi:hypothetical protein